MFVYIYYHFFNLGSYRREGTVGMRKKTQELKVSIKYEKFIDCVNSSFYVTSVSQRVGYVQTNSITDNENTRSDLFWPRRKIIHFRFLAGAKDFSFLHCVQAGSAIHSFLSGR
jgi:ABC-type xylose transport system substrate-binding protein